jgi:CheY-like chemotaxis protein
MAIDFDHPPVQAAGEPLFRPPARLLVVDDLPLNLRLIESIFQPPSYDVHSLTDNRRTLAVAAECRPEVILLDVMMPGDDGFMLCQKLKDFPATATVPVIFITARDSIRDRLAGFEAGGVDYVAKPFNHFELTARVGLQIRLRRMTQERETLTRLALEERREASIARMTAGVAHNFSNLLGASLGNFMFLERQVGNNPPPPVREALDDLRESLQRQQRIVRQFLHLTDRGRISRHHGGTPQPDRVSLAPLIAAVMEAGFSGSSEPEAPSPWNVVIPPDAAIRCDADHAQEIFHLLMNELATLAGARSRLELHVATVGNHQIQCHFTGDALPLPPDVGEIIFEPFALPLANVGTGLAFAVAKQLAEQNGGTIRATIPMAEVLDIDLRFPAA